MSLTGPPCRKLESQKFPPTQAPSQDVPGAAPSSWARGRGRERGFSEPAGHGGRGGSWFWEDQAGMTIPCVPALGAAGRAPGCSAAAAEAAPGGSYLGHGADVTAGVGAPAATPCLGRGVRVGATPCTRSGDPAGPGVRGAGWQAEPCLGFPASAMGACVDGACGGMLQEVVGAGVAGLWAAGCPVAPPPSGAGFGGWVLLVSEAQPSSGHRQQCRVGRAGYVGRRPLHFLEPQAL